MQSSPSGSQTCCWAQDVLEDAFMPALFKVMRLALASGQWKEVRACIMAVSQVVEYVEEEAWIDQCLDFLGPHYAHAHPRVRFCAFQALGQIAYDHDTMTRLFTRLQKGETRNMQESCLAAIAVVGEAGAELFEPYYDHILPVLKQLIASCSGDHQRTLRGKAFECASLLGEGVGKELTSRSAFLAHQEMFAKDAHEIMQVMVQFFQAGFAPDDETREYIHEAPGRVATLLGKDFKPYMSALLPSLFAVLDQTPKEMSLEEEDDDFTHALVDGKSGRPEVTVALTTGVSPVSSHARFLDEMTETITLIGSLVEALEDVFLDFMPDTCRHLMPLLDFALSDEVQEKAYQTWEHVVQCARCAMDHGKCDPSLVSQVTGELLKKTVTMMTTLAQDGEDPDPARLHQLQGQAIATAAVIKKAGPKVLAKQDVADLVKVLGELLMGIQLESSTQAELPPRKRGQGKNKGSDSESDSDSTDGGVCGQTVRFGLVDVFASLMQMSPEHFLEVGLPLDMELMKALLQKPNDADRSLALYMASDVVEHMGEPRGRSGQAAAVRPVHLGKKPKTLLYQTKLSHHHQRKVIDKLSAKIGNESLGWKAKTMEKWNGLSMLQVNSYAGIKRSRRSTAMLRQHAAKLKTLSGRVKRRTRNRRQKECVRVPTLKAVAVTIHLPELSTWSFLQQTSVLQLSKPLPGSWDWTNVSGRNFVEPVMDQSECGSCYVAAAVRMLTARHKIKQNNTEEVPWSIAFPLRCSEYNQGCRGGYGILAAKWSQEVGLLPAPLGRQGAFSRLPRFDFVLFVLISL
eukprot:g32299.t1